jgi:hypothetical protein
LFKFLPLTLTLSHRGRGDLLSFPSLDGRGLKGRVKPKRATIGTEFAMNKVGYKPRLE